MRISWNVKTVQWFYSILYKYIRGAYAFSTKKLRSRSLMQCFHLVKPQGHHKLWSPRSKRESHGNLQKLIWILQHQNVKHICTVYLNRPFKKYPKKIYHTLMAEKQPHINDHPPSFLDASEIWLYQPPFGFFVSNMLHGIRYHDTTLPQSEENHQISSVAKIVAWSSPSTTRRVELASWGHKYPSLLHVGSQPVRLPGYHGLRKREEKWRNNCNHPESVGYLFLRTTTDQTTSFSTRQKLKKINEPNKIIHQVREMIQETDSGIMTQINFNLGNGAK